MDLRAKNEFKQKMNELYSELNGINHEKKKIKPKQLFSKESERIKIINKLLSQPSKTVKPKKTIYTLIEETKRLHLNQKSFLPIDIEKDSLHRKYVTSDYIKGVNNAPSFDFKSSKRKDSLNIFDDESRYGKSFKNETLKKEIMNQLEKGFFQSEQYNNFSNLSTMNKTFREFESSFGNSKLVF